MKTWVIITGEYPPKPGGVADYTRSVAQGLASAGDAVHIFAPRLAAGPSVDPGVEVHLFPGHFGPSALRQMRRELSRIAGPYTILVQYVPHAFGYKAMNVPFCFWLYRRRKRGIWIMFHEVCVDMGRHESIRHNILGAVTRIMAWLVLHSAQRVFVTIPAWIARITPLAPKRLPIRWLPVPSNVVTEVRAERAAEIRSRLPGASRGSIVGHFGTYGEAVSNLLRQILPVLLERQPDITVLLVGRSSNTFATAFVSSDAQFQDRIVATGDLPAADVAAYLAACDVVIQPYPDGASCRRTSLMASLALGRPVVTNEGHLSEPIWRASAAVAVAPIEDVQAFVSAVLALLADPVARAALGERGLQLYNEKFTLACTIEGLRQADNEFGGTSGVKGST